MVMVLGVDGAPDGWAWICVEQGRDGVAVRAGGLVRQLGELFDRVPEAAVVGVDIPIGFPAGAQARRADLAAKRLLGPRRSSVFVVPPREALETPTYAEANQVCREVTGKGLSKQSYYLRDKVLEANALVAEEPRLHEVHPELSFTALAGAPLDHYKKSWNGLERRRRLLASVGLEVPPDLDFGRAGADDVLDALVAAWTAGRIAEGSARTAPDDPEEGEPVIWF